MEKANATAKTFPAVKNCIPALGTAAGKLRSGNGGGRATSSMFHQSKNSGSFLDERGGGDTSRTTAMTRVNKAAGGKFGFRNHSLALGSTVRHFQTITDFPIIPSKHERARSNLNSRDAKKITMSKVPDAFDALKSDPRALEIFIDELALADQSQPKHLRFLSDLPQHVNSKNPKRLNEHQRR